jgi:hypothetical protein
VKRIGGKRRNLETLLFAVSRRDEDLAAIIVREFGWPIPADELDAALLALWDEAFYRAMPGTQDAQNRDPDPNP